VLRQLLAPTLTAANCEAVEAEHGYLGRYVLAAEGAPEVLFCDNETDAVALFGAERNASRYPKDGINRRVVHEEKDAVNPADTDTKAAFWYRWDAVQPGETVSVRLRLQQQNPDDDTFGPQFEQVLTQREHEADEFYGHVIHPSLDDEDRHVARRAYAGLL
jgi:hypothetical protein